MQKLDWPQIDDLIQRSLDEDLGRGDITSEALIPGNRLSRATIIAKSSGILAGIDVAARVFHEVDPFIKFKKLLNDGNKIKPHMDVAQLEGKAQSLLKGERVALNFLQHMSGIATLTSQYVAKVEGLSVRILDTRKTLPGLRMLEKYAVSAGGGQNHRIGLYDMVLIKDNHISILHKDGLNIADIVRLAKRDTPPTIKIEVETTTPTEALQAAEAGADIIMLDNMSPADMKEAVRLVDHRAIVEASGGVNLDTVRAIAETGVDWISVGALTHSVRALDLSMEFIS